MLLVQTDCLSVNLKEIPVIHPDTFGQSDLKEFVWLAVPRYSIMVAILSCSYYVQLHYIFVNNCKVNDNNLANWKNCQSRLRPSGIGVGSLVRHDTSLGSDAWWRGAG